MTTFGRIVSNALQERIDIGGGTSRKSIAKYTIQELLAEGFQLWEDDALDGLTMLEGYDEVK